MSTFPYIITSSCDWSLLTKQVNKAQSWWLLCSAWEPLKNPLTYFKGTKHLLEGWNLRRSRCILLYSDGRIRGVQLGRVFTTGQMLLLYFYCWSTFSSRWAHLVWSCTMWRAFSWQTRDFFWKNKQTNNKDTKVEHWKQENDRVERRTAPQGGNWWGWKKRPKTSVSCWKLECGSINQGL